jgi:hypothetical protein
MSKKKWLYAAYKTIQDWRNSNPYLTKPFSDFGELRAFSGEHSAKEKLLHPGYCSDYWDV